MKLMAHAYSYPYQHPATAAFFFTVYGPWGRPDMAIVHVAKAILDGAPIKLFTMASAARFYLRDDVARPLVRSSIRPPGGTARLGGCAPAGFHPAAPGPGKLTISATVVRKSDHMWFAVLEKECGHDGREGIAAACKAGDVEAIRRRLRFSERDIGFPALRMR